MQSQANVTKTFILVSNRGPNFKSATKLHFSAGGTGDAYMNLVSNFCHKWLCICSDKLSSNSVESNFDDKLQVIFVKDHSYSRYYYEFISECLYPVLLGYPSKAISCDKYSDYLYVMNVVIEEMREYMNFDVILCDYHLYKLPTLIDWKCRKIFFWFIPFLNVEFHKNIHKEIVEGLSKCEKVFFLTNEYSNNFKRSFEYYFPDEDLNTNLEVLIPGPDRGFEQAEYISRKDFQESLKYFDVEFSDHDNYLLSVSRLDFVKNIPLTIQGFEYYLKNHPNSNSHLLIIAPHHRESSEIYQDEERSISSILSRLSCKSRVHVIHRRFNREELKVLYKFCHMFILASRFDGMPLSPLEYALSNNGCGSIVTSNTSGTYRFIGNYAYSFESESFVSLGQAISRAICDSPEDKKTRLSSIKTLVKSVTIDHWVDEVAKVISNEK
ncbi:trehalose-6-phosphate synthase [Spirulina sp. CCNP1310]|nr:trehalose-6-phosphate synthase [Spirulina sp. CCNP1310]MEA5418053.1 trehalose-6-phosphate synthase [Spirulina sp. CCNP1310]